MPVPYTVITAQSTGYTGAPGWHRMKFIGSLTGAECTTVSAAMKAFYNSLLTITPAAAKMTWQQPAQVFSDTGVLLNEVTIPTLPSQLQFTGAGGYAGGTGAVVFWNTGALNGGHKVRGRTYLVPLTSNSYDSSGLITTAAQSTINAAAAALVATTPGLCVNSRNLGKPGRGDQTVVVQSASLSSTVAFLSTRKR